MELRACISKVLVLAHILLLSCQVSAKRSQVLYCGACLAFVEEMNWGLNSLTDRRDKIQVGSFRLDSEGRQNLNEIPLRLSEIHILETMESACNEVGRYVEVKKSGKNKINYIRKDARDGTKVSMKNVDTDEHKEKTLKFACDTIVEEHEDEVLKMYQQEEDEVQTKLCVEITELCRPHNLTDVVDLIEELKQDYILEQLEKEEQKRAEAVSESKRNENDDEGDEEDLDEDEYDDDDDDEDDDDDYDDEDDDYDDDDEDDDDDDDDDEDDNDDEDDEDDDDDYDYIDRDDRDEL